MARLENEYCPLQGDDCFTDCTLFDPQGIDGKKCRLANTLEAMEDFFTAATMFTDKGSHAVMMTYNLEEAE